jgi:hypothetical protein
MVSGSSRFEFGQSLRISGLLTVIVCLIMPKQVLAKYTELGRRQSFRVPCYKLFNVVPYVSVIQFQLLVVPVNECLISLMLSK